MVAEKHGHAVAQGGEGFFGKLLGAGEAIFGDGDGAADFDDNLVYEGRDFASGDGGDGGVYRMGVDDAANVGPAAVDAEMEGGFGGGGEVLFNRFAVEVDY